ncbi:uncharacterized protein LOC131242870 isoform X2 [Magnolia sinica]|uniref:uncharacterized protein LOC131242870 isoform X2 n=1 Tax=Magnolia sinica TaxID=86752 RepID=UPI00265A2EE1|nr:uncharacterized protein LOC131242870 isoform X2 [Magnolia sinica]
MEGGITVFGNFMRQNSIKSLFRGRKTEKETDASIKPIPQLSPIANSVITRCSRILQLSTEDLQHQFETELPDHFKEPSTYARNLLEYGAYKALNIVIRSPDHLADKEFRRLTFDMMLAWEDPGTESVSLHKTASSSNPEIEDEEGGSLFYTNSTSMAIQVDERKTVGPDAFARIAPACPAVADIITVDNLFYMLTSASGGQLHFLIYDKYLGSLRKVIKTAKSASGRATGLNLQLSKGEIVLDVDGTIPTQPVLQHIGISAWPGRLTLTNHALYFESFGVGLHDKTVVYDLTMDLKQVVKPELTGPLGARLFDKAMMYKSTSVAEPVYLEFPEFKGHSRRDYWLAITSEVLHVHRFIRRFNMKEIQQAEALSRATLGIFRYRAVREVFHILPSHFKTLLAFDLAGKLPGGDTILETLSSRLALLSTQSKRSDVSVGTSNNARLPTVLSPFSVMTLSRLGFVLPKEVDFPEEAELYVGDVCVGEINPLEMAVKESKFDSSKAEAAQATVDQVKVEGIDTNVAVMKELLFPVVESIKRLQFLASWEDPFKSTLFLVLICYAIYRGWIKYMLPFILAVLATLMLWRKHRSKGKPLEAFKVNPPPSRNPFEQLIALQEAISQFEMLVQDGNIVLLKLRALLLAALPQATDKVALFLVIMAAVFAIVPLKYLFTFAFLEWFTREIPFRKEVSEKWTRRIREWWVRIPAAPVQLIKAEDNSKKRK